MMGLAAILFSLSPAASADVVVLSSDVFIEGIVIDETPTDVKFQVSESGYAMYPKSGLLQLVMDPPGTNASLRKRWRRQEIREEEREEREERMRDAAKDEPADDPSPPMPLLSQQAPVNVTVNVNVESYPGVGVVVGPAHLPDSPAMFRDRFGPRPLINPGPIIGPSSIHINSRSIASPGNIHLNR